MVDGRAGHARVELWTASSNVPGQAATMARAAESDGFDGLSFGDTQCLNADPFVGLTVAASVTTGLKLAVGVTNPVTRHPAATACAIASVQIESGGRAVLGIGRGDSAGSKPGGCGRRPAFRPRGCRSAPTSVSLPIPMLRPPFSSSSL